MFSLCSCESRTVKIIFCSLFLYLAQPQKILSQSPTAPAQGFNLFIRNEVKLAGSETQGPVAAGGSFTLTGDHTIASQNAGIFKVSNVPIGLLIGGKAVYQSGNGININSNAYVKMGDCTGSKVWYKDNNGASANIRITSGSDYNGAPRINIQTNANSLGVSETVNPVCASNVLDFEAAFAQLKNNSIAIAACPDNIELTAANGDPVINYFEPPNNSQITLTNPVNIITLPGSSMNAFQQFKINGSRPDANHILIFNIDAAGSFTYTGLKTGEIGSGEGPYVFYNFYNTTQLTLNLLDQMPGTLFAPFANIIKTDTRNLVGQVIGQSFEMTQGSINYAVFAGNVPGCGGCIPPEVNNISGANKVCITKTTQLLNTTAGGVWSSDDATIASVSSSGLVRGLRTGTTTIRYTVTNSCGSAFKTISMTVNALPGNPIVTAAGATSFCFGDSVILSSSLANSYQWYKNGVSIGGADKQFLTVKTSGTYNVIVSNSSECSSDYSNSVTVAVFSQPAKPVITAGSSTTFCVGEQVILTSSASAGNQWYLNGIILAGEKNPSIVAKIGGDYTVVVTNGNGCSSLISNGMLITVNSLPVLGPISGSNTVCVNGTTLYTNATLNGRWSSSNESIAIVDSLTGLVKGIQESGAKIKYTVVNSSGCSNTSSKLISVNAVPSLSEIAGADNVCENSSIRLFNSTPGGVWSSNSPIATVSQTGLVTGISAGAAIISYILTNEFGCASVVTKAITVNALPPVSPINVPNNSELCVLNTLQLINNTIGGVWSSQNENIATVNTTGLVYGVSVGAVQIRYTVTNSNGCSAQANTIITVLSNPPTPTIAVGGPTSFCFGGSVVLTSSASSGNQWYRDGLAISGATGINYTANSQGAYSVVVTNSSGCVSQPSASEQVSVTAIPSAPVLTASGPLIFCTGGSVDLFSSAVSGNQWYKNGAAIPGAVNQTYRATATGNYTVTRITPDGCSSTSSNAAAVVQNDQPNIPLISPGSATTFCAGGSVILTANANGSSVTGYQWLSSPSPLGSYTQINGATSSTYTATITGYYKVVVSNAAGCSRTAASSVHVVVNALPATPTISTGGPTSFCEGGNVVLTSSSSTGNKWYRDGVYILSGNGAQTYTASSSGLYTLLVTNSNNCNSLPITGVTVTVNALPAKPVITTSDSTSFCTGSAGSKADLLSSSVNGNQWYKDAVIIPGAVSQMYTATVTGNYTVVTTNNGCSSVASDVMKITANSGNQLPVIVAIGNTTFCDGGSVLLISSSNIGNQWYKDGALLGGQTSKSYIATTTGNYTVSAINNTACVNGTSLTTTVNVNPIPSAGNITGGSAVCLNNTIQLSNATAGGVWQSSNNGIATVSATGLVSGVAAGTVTIIYTVTSGAGCTGSTSQLITVNAPTVLDDISGPTAVCVGASITLSNSTAGGSWSTSNSATASINATTGIVTGIAAGNVTITYSYTNSSACNSTTQWSVKVNPQPIVSAITGGTSVCVNSKIILSNTTKGGTWSSDNTLIANINSSGELSGVGIGATAIRYIVIDSNGCSSSPNAASLITVNEVPNIPTVNPEGNINFCNGGSVVLTAVINTTVVTGYQWTFSDSPDGIYVNITGATNATYSATNTGYYKVVVSNSNNCSQSSVKFAHVVVLDVPSTPIITAGSATTFCEGGTTVLTATAAQSYQWYKNGSLISGATGQSYIVNSTGIYSIITKNSNGCSSLPSNTISVTVNPVPPIPSISTGGATTFCSGSAVLLTSSNIGADQYQWYLNGSQIIGATGRTYTAVSGGFYTVITAASLTGCKSDPSAAVQVKVNPIPLKPILFANGPLGFCDGGSVIINSSIATLNQWYKDGVIIAGATAQTYTATVSGSYTVIRTDGNGCSSGASKAVIVDVYGLPAVPIITANGPLTFCKGGSVTLTSSAAAAYQWFRNGVAIKGATLNNFTAKEGDSYSVQVANAKGCNSLSAASLVTVNKNPPISEITGDNSVCVGNTSQLFNANTGGVWVSSNTAIATVNTAGIVTGIGAGLATVSYTITNNSGCSSVSTIDITVSATPSVPRIIAKGPATFCDGGSVLLISSSSSGNQWIKNGLPFIGENDQVLVVTAGGNYSVIVVNASGCISNGASNVLTVTVNPVPEKPVIIDKRSAVFCEGGSVVLTSSAIIGNQWYKDGNILAGENGKQYTANTRGEYSTIVTNSFGCASEESNAYNVAVDPLPATPLLNAEGATTFCAGGSVLLRSNSESGNQWFYNGTPIQGENNTSYLATASGDYTVVVTDSKGCSSASSDAIKVVVNNLPNINSITGKSVVCVNGTSTLSNTTPGGKWTSANEAVAVIDQLNGILTGIREGTSQINYTVTDLNGCSASVSRVANILANPPQPIISEEGSTNFCIGSSVNLISSVGSSYQWYKDGAVISGATNRNYVAANTGSYQVVVINADGCSSVQSIASSVIVNDRPETPVITAGGGLSICSGSSVKLTSSALVGNQWYKNGLPIKTATRRSLIVSTGGVYAVIVTNASGCRSSLSNGLTVTVNPLPIVGPIKGPRSVCEGNTITLTNSTASGIWGSSNTSIATIDPATGIVTGINAGFSSISYTVTSASGCSSSTNLLIRVTAIPTLPIITAQSATSFCSGESVDLLSSSETGNQWFKNGIAINGATNQIYTAASTGEYTVVVTGGNGCISNGSSSPVSVTVFSLPTVSPITGTTTLCLNNSSILSDATTGGIWSSSDESIATISNTGLLMGNNPGTVTITYLVTNANNCSAAASTLVTIYALPIQPVISEGGPSVFCNGGAVILTSSSGVSYQWYRNNTIISRAKDQTYTASIAGIYSVVTTDINGCSSPASLGSTITVYENPVAPIITADGSTSICSGSSVKLRSNTISANQWYLNGVAILGETGQTYTATVAGIYTATTTSNNGCTSTQSNEIPVTVSSLPATPVISAGGSTLFCAGGSVVLNSSAGFAYQWSRNGKLIKGATNQTYAASETGSYVVNVMSVNGCVSAKSNLIGVITFERPPKPGIFVTTPTNICLGDSVLLTSTAATGNQWYKDGNKIPGETRNVYIAKLAGIYTTIVTNSNQCSSIMSDGLSVIVNSVPPTPQVTPAGPVQTCLGTTVQLRSNAGSGNQWYRNGTAIPNAVSNTYITGNTGNYSVVVTNSSDCSSPISNLVAVTINSLPITPIILADGPTSFCSGGSVKLVSSIAANYQWNLNGKPISGATSQTYQAVATGNYSVTVINNNGCSVSSSSFIPVNVIPMPTGNILGPPVRHVCTNGSIILEAFGGFLYQWFKDGVLINGVSGSLLTVTNKGIYTVVVTNEAGCSAPGTNSVNVLVIQKPVVDFTYERYCVNQPTYFTNTSDVSGSGPVIYTWSSGIVNSEGGSASPTYTFTNTGTFPVKLTVTPYLCPISRDSITKNVQIVGPIPAIRMLPADVAVNDPVTLQARSIGTAYVWSPATFLSSATIPNPVITATKEQTYQISILNPSSCITVDTLQVRVHDANTIYLPTVFSPNGDGLNDKLYLNYVGIKELKSFIIYNRWGKKVFETRNLNDAWDGTVNGARQAMDSYTWILEAIDKNGKLIAKQGTITLLR